uniref:Uncharacterized protein n=1 Tax=Romanomermis culicivorax TaxID=13658 RepID=A0A915JCG4_ROMCU
MSSCPMGTKCRERGPLEPSGVVETVCCNRTLLALSKNPNEEHCKNGRPVWHGLFQDGMLRPVLAQTCQDMICHDAYECHQQNVLFAKCCRKKIS